MDKKMIALIIAIIVIVLGIGSYFILNNNSNTNNKISENKSQSSNNTVSINNGENNINNSVINNNQKSEEIKQDENISKKVAIVYFSATGTTKAVAEYIKDTTNGDIFEIIPKEKYTSEDLNWNNNNSRSTKEQNDKNSRPEISNRIDVSSYEVIFLGYPIWWNDTPRIIQTFMDNTNLSGKTVIPFCTSGGSGISGSENTLKSYTGINWISGKRLGTSKNDIVNWVKSLNF